MNVFRWNPSTDAIALASIFVTLVLIFCKIFHIIEWAWFWVYSPLIIGFGFLLLLFVIGNLIMMFARNF